MLIRSPNDLAGIVHEQRKQSGVSQSKAASRVGLKQNTISNFEKDPLGTKLDTLFRILSALDLEMHIAPKSKSDRGSEEW